MDTSCSFQQNFVSWHCLHVSQLHKLNKSWSGHCIPSGRPMALSGCWVEWEAGEEESKAKQKHYQPFPSAPVVSLASLAAVRDIHFGSGFGCQPTQISALAPFLPLRLKAGVLIYPAFLRELYWGGGRQFFRFKSSQVVSRCLLKWNKHLDPNGALTPFFSCGFQQCHLLMIILEAVLAE